MSTLNGRPDQLFNVPHTAEILALKAATIRKLIAQRRIEVCRIGRSVRIRESEILRIQREGLQPRRGEVRS